MGANKDADVLASMAAALEPLAPEEIDAFLNAMSMPELASIWCALQRLSRRYQTGSAWAAIMYFDHLPHHLPERALDLVLEVLRSEPDKPTVMQLNDKFLPSLMYAHGPEVIGRIETEAAWNASLRWLVGGVLFGAEEPLKSRVEAIADTDAWRVDETARRTPQQPLDCEMMSVPQLARAWVTQNSKSDRDRDDNFFAMMDYERDLRDADPDKAIDLILEILEIETSPVLLSLLAAGPLEDVIKMETIDRVEREARANQRFRDLLGGVWYYRAPDELKARLDALMENR